MKKILFIALMLLCSTLSRAQNIVKMEYWIDSDPGFDSAYSITGFSPQTDISSFIFTADSTSSLSPGIHTVGIRSKDDGGQWSHTNFFQLLVVETESRGNIVGYEYFWDVDSGFNNGFQHTPAFNVSDTSNYFFNATIPLLGANLTNHTFFIRTLDDGGKWSLTNYASVFVISTVDVKQLHNESCVRVYPNPFIEDITVTPNLNKPARILLCDEGGKVLIDKIISQETRLNTEGFSRGAYWIYVWADNQLMYRTTIIKQ